VVPGLKVKVKNLYSPGQALRFPGGRGSQISKQHIKVVSFSALCIGHLTPWKRSWYSFLLQAERIMTMKNSNYTVGNRTCVLPTCSSVPPVPVEQIKEKVF
jgi:hypothetical protein